MTVLQLWYRLSAIALVTLNLFNEIWPSKNVDFHFALFIWAFALVIFALSDILFTLYTIKENLK